MAGFERLVDINPEAKVGIICHKGTWGLKVKEACARSGLNNVTQIYTELGKLEETLNFDLLFIAEDYYSDITGGELLDSLLSNKKLKATTATIMVGNLGETVVHNYDSAIILLDFLPEVFSQALFQATIERMLGSQKAFISVMSFVAAGRLSFAYKALLNLDKAKIPKQLIVEYCKLQVNLAFELGKYKQVLAICDKPMLKEYDWTVWPRFKANYELGNWQYCQESMQKREFLTLPAGPMKLFWQLRILIEHDHYTQAIELLESYPKQDMSLSMIRLSFALMSVSGNWQDAEDFISRKIRLSHSSPLMQATLINSQCTIFLYEYYAASSNDRRVHAMERLREHLKQFSLHKMAFKFKRSIEVFLIYLQIAELSQNSDVNKAQELVKKLAEVEKHVSAPVLLCRVAYAWHLLGEPQRCFETLLKADCAFGYTPFGCERLLLAMMFKQILFNIYQGPERATVFRKLGEFHQKEQRYKLACKAYSRALAQKGSDQKTLDALAESMSSAGIDVFAGYQLSKLSGEPA